ncbi:recombinase family protein [Pedococcus sp. 5OH_020]|uniref:recombinase family protein n=1 Tax=Pedococcus sp. 5OH_020 TaxID=2989814 RepID=UPI0022E9D343|nr:recombinase family protein [Pedococcus sp. 5OH_020]
MESERRARAAVYARVSQDRAEGRSVSEQEAESRRACANNGWAVAAVYADNDVSASRFTTKRRADWTRLVSDLDSGMFDVLVLWEPSRGSRDLVTWAALLDVCRRQKVLLHVTSHGRTYDPGNPRDWRTLADDGVDSAYESEKQSQRITRAMAANAKAGRPHGRVPYGYVRSYDPATKAFVGQEPDPETAAVVREIIGRVGRAEPVIAVSRDLNARGVRPPAARQWSRQHVRRIALNPSYAGLRLYAGESYEGTWPALVDAAEFYAAKRLLEDPARRKTKPGRNKYLLSYIARCGVCDEQLQAAPRGRAVPSYFCAGGHVQAGVAWLDALIEGVVLARLDDGELLARLTVADDEQAVAARAKIGELRERLAEWRDAAANGKASPASLAHIETNLLADIEVEERKVQRAGAPAALVDLLGADVIADRWRTLQVAQRREVVKVLGMAITLNRANASGRHAAGAYDRVAVEWPQP